MTRIGIVGLGYWGSKVVEEYVALRESDDVKAVVACDLDPERLADAPDVDDRYRDVETMLPHVDGIHICTKNETHVPLAKKALNDGVHVVVEKPMTLSSHSAFDLVEHASRTGQILQTGHIFRFANVVRTLAELIEEDYFGETYYFDIEWTHLIEPRFEEGVLWDLLTHPVDILNFVTGAWPRTVSGTVDSYRTDIDEAASLVLSNAADNVRADVRLSWVDPVKRRTVRVVGSERSAVAECVQQTLTIHEDGESYEYGVEPNNTIRAEARNFVEAIETGENTFNSAIVGARAVDVIETVQDEVVRADE